MSLILVTGATGPVGRAVIDGLLGSDHQVRAVSRTPGDARLPASVEVVAGDLSVPETLEPALTGASSLVLISMPETVHEVIDRARRADVHHVVVVSSAAVTAGYDTTYNLEVERAVMGSGLGWSIVRPGEFATNALLIWGPSIREHRRVVEPFPDQVGRPIHEGDIADVVIADLLDPRRRGRIDTIVGPDSLTKREQVAAIAAAIGDDITLDQVSPQRALDFYRAQGGFAAANADFLFGFESYDGVAGAVDEPHDTDVPDDGRYLTLAEVTGGEPRSYARWARDHASEFTSA